jgi:FeS assembly protein SufD
LDSQTAVEVVVQTIASRSEHAGEPTWLRDLRIEAFNVYKKLPVEISSLYTKHSELKVDVDNYNVGKSVSWEQTSLDSLNANLGLEQNVPGRTQVGTKIGWGQMSSNVEVSDIIRAMVEQSDTFRDLVRSRAISLGEDKFVAFNTAFFDCGLFLRVPKNEDVKIPIRNLTFLDPENPISVGYNVILAEEGSRVTLLSESYCHGRVQSGLLSQVTEIYLKDNAQVNYAEINGVDKNTIVLANRRAICGRDSRIVWTVGNFGGSLTRSRLDSHFRGQGASAEDVEVVFADSTQKFDLVSDLVHEATDTKGRIVAKGVLKDKARSIFKGMIRIGKEAKRADAYLAEHAMLLSPEARSDAIPGLEIATNEVRATHAASVAQIDDEEIFYLMSRGLDENEAKKMIILGFLEPAVIRIPVEEVRERLRIMVEDKWSGIETPISLKGYRTPAFFEEEEAKETKDIFEGHYKYR